jgi:hypothetical protein
VHDVLAALGDQSGAIYLDLRLAVIDGEGDPFIAASVGDGQAGYAEPPVRLDILRSCRITGTSEMNGV